MATIRPFMAIRPAEAYAKDVAALPYDVMNSEEAREMVQGKPWSFLHVDKAEVDLPKDIDVYSPAVYAKAKENLENMIHNGILGQDLLPNLYLYRMTMNGRSQTGLVCCTSVDEYINGTIKKHELTRADKEADRIRHVDTLNANTGPIFLAYKENKDAKAIIDGWTAAVKPVYDFVAEDGIGHTVWVIDSDTEIGMLVESFKQVKNLYIADGHHRNASAVKVALKRREAKPDYTGEEEFNYYLSVLFAAEDLYIMDYNRVVKDLNGYRGIHAGNRQEIRHCALHRRRPLPPRSTAHLWAVSGREMVQDDGEGGNYYRRPCFGTGCFHFAEGAAGACACHRRPQNRQAD